MLGGRVQDRGFRALGLGFGVLGVKDSDSRGWCVRVKVSWLEGTLEIVWVPDMMRPRVLKALKKGVAVLSTHPNAGPFLACTQKGSQVSQPLHTCTILLEKFSSNS